jgi:hypothetical protein
MIHKRAEQPNGKKHKHDSGHKTDPVQRSTLQNMRARAEHLFCHSDNYETMNQLKPFVAYAGLPMFSTDPERALIILHNCYVMKKNNGYNSNAAGIVKSITSILGTNLKGAGNMMSRLESAAKTVAGEDESTIDGADLKVGFSRKEPKAERPMTAPVEHDESEHLSDGEPTDAALKRISKDHDDLE